MQCKYFIDTNIIIYTFDKNEIRKKKISDDIIMRSLQKNNGIISYQVIQEFLNVSLTKFKNPLNTVDCKFYIETILYCYDFYIKLGLPHTYILLCIFKYRNFNSMNTKHLYSIKTSIDYTVLADFTMFSPVLLFF